MSLGDLVRAVFRPGGSRSTEAARSPAVTPQPGQNARGYLEGRSALIVGAGANIGLGVARELAREGARLSITSASREELAVVADALRADGISAPSLLSDITADGAEDTLVDELDRLGFTPDLLVLNVGMHAARGEPEVAEMERMFRTNVIAPLHLARRLAARMRAKSGGSILFMSSIHQSVLFGEPLYSATKAAVGMIVRELAAEYASARIRVNAIAPGWVAAAADGAPLPHRLTPLYNSSIPPAFIGKAAVFLAADSLSGHTTGTVLVVDGGASLLNPIVSPAYLDERK